MAVRKASVKLVGNNGQVSLGKQFAGRQVIVEEREPGYWVIRTATVIPDDELWLHQEDASYDLKEALAWAKKKPQNDKNIHKTLKTFSDD